jgi:hypothetical protein
MADGLTMDELDALLAPATPAPAPQYPPDNEDAHWTLLYRKHRVPLDAPKAVAVEMMEADAVRDEIFRRHGIPEGTSALEAAKIVEARAEQAGIGPSAWANPEERSAAREAYAREGKTPEEVRRRWEESQYLLDPRTVEYMDAFGRDEDFLVGEAKSDFRSAGKPGAPRETRPDDVRHYKESRGERLSRAGGWNPLPTGPAGYQRFNNFGQALMDNTANPDTTTGFYSGFSEVVPNAIRMRGGRSESAGEAMDASKAHWYGTMRYRTAGPHPILDLKGTPDRAAIASRLKELQDELQSASPPMADERWYQSSKGTFVPPGWVTGPLDWVTSWADPTAVIPATGAVRAGVGATKAAAKGAKLAGAAKTAFRPVVANAKQDFVTDTALSAGVETAVGGQSPERTWPEFLVGNWGVTDEGKKALAARAAERGFADKDEANRRRAASQALYERTKSDDGVSRADDEAYKRLIRSGAVPNPSREVPYIGIP